MPLTTAHECDHFCGLPGEEMMAKSLTIYRDSLHFEEADGPALQKSMLGKCWIHAHWAIMPFATLCMNELPLLRHSLGGDDSVITHH